jgi:hypothetical protein
MPGDPKECRENAKRCLESAQSARTLADRERFEGLAQRWLDLAADFEATNMLLGKWSTGPITLIGEMQEPNASGPPNNCIDQPPEASLSASHQST